MSHTLTPTSRPMPPILAATIAIDALHKAVACYGNHAYSPQLHAVEVALRHLDDTQSPQAAHRVLTQALSPEAGCPPLDTSMDACLCHLVALALEHPSLAMGRV